MVIPWHAHTHRDEGAHPQAQAHGGSDLDGGLYAAAAGLELSPVSLQQLIIRRTNTSEKEFEVSA